MDSSKYKSVPKGAGKKVAEVFKKSRKQEPSDRLVKIISEIGEDSQEKKIRRLSQIVRLDSQRCSFE